MEYRLRDIVELTGFSKQVLHAWERRHQLMEPRTGSDGARVYSDDEVHRLQLFKHCIDNGHRIGKIAKLELDDLKRIARPDVPNACVPLDALLSAVNELDAKSIETQLSVHFATLGPVKFAELIVVPLMTRIGMLWRDGQMSIAAEHCSTAIIRTLLGQGLRLMEPPNSSSLALFTTLQGETHELGALTAAIMAQSCGTRSLYMGQSLPCESLVKACQTLNATAVGLSSKVSSEKEILKQLEALQSLLPPHIEIWLGGEAIMDLKRGLDGRSRYFEGPHDFLAAVHRHNVRTSRSAPARTSHGSSGLG